MADVQAKYQKLATEYAKLKAQIPVLKKAFLDEQEEKTALKDLLKEKEQSVRKYESETDSLSFRNQQLSKRVLLLQEELETAESNKKKHKNKVNDVPNGESSRREAGIFNEELQNKIEENARLHKQVNESSTIYEEKVQKLEESLRNVELEHSQYNEVLNATKQQSKTQIDNLLEEKALLEGKLLGQDSDVKQFKMRAEVAEIKLKSVQTDLSGRLESVQKLVTQKLPFIDTANSEINNLNVPVYDRQYILHSTELVNQACAYVSELVQSFSNFYTYSEQRSKIYPIDGISETMSATNIAYCKLLHGNLTYLRPVEQSLKTFGDALKDDSQITSTVKLQFFCENFHKFVVYNNDLLPYQLSSIEEECAVSSCPSVLSNKNMELYKSFEKLNKVFNQLDQYVAILVSSTTEFQETIKRNYEVAINLSNITEINLVNFLISKLSKVYNAKVSLEHQLPTATQKLKTTDECIVSSLISLVTSSNKIATFMSNNLEFFNEINKRENTENGNTVNPIVGNYKMRTEDYLTSLTMPCPKSVPYSVALENRKILISSAENKEGLAKQVEKFQKNLTVLEQEKEHYMLELQLLKIKYENEMHKRKNLEKEIGSLKKGSVSVDNPAVENLKTDRPSNRGSLDSITAEESLMCKLETTGINESDVGTREELIKSHYTSRLNQLTLQLQHTDSKCVSFHSEVRALHKQLQLAEKQKNSAEDELKVASQSLAQLKDEHQTTTKSYENQLSMMSEHLAGMNEKLAQQKDEIDEQKLQLHGKSKSLKKKK
ncbi:hypothetical protein LOTGIDRAFT_201851 [Lottia gigantea]|uniref:Protein phosphatase 1 regulatory subunit 21 n=1 Tax=Lottia gigantea TaxID=225164 RepID=V4AWT7_LOTGI|nr:hypothetical protein LOTGIDRAFT_201851 [Lottia gigantea]ESO98001.1 hypothetical protein LOTGIDRAFT_201851 [Lottia gigantea]